MAVSVERDKDEGPVSAVASDEKVLDPESELAVQVPEEGKGERDALSVHEEPTPEEVFAAAEDSDEADESEADDDE